MSTTDDKRSVVALPGSIIDVQATDRGGADAAELASAQRAVTDASSRAASSSTATETAEAVERRKLIIEIRVMKRHRINVAVRGVVRGAMYTGAAWLLYRAGQWFIQELRRPPTAPPSPTSTPPQSEQRTDSQSAGRAA
jgi:hypothetical protein